MSEEKVFDTDLEVGNYIMLKPKTHHGRNVVKSLGEYWIINDIQEIEEVDTFVISRCIIEQDFRGGPERLVIDTKNDIMVDVNDDNNYDYEQVEYTPE